MFEVSSEGESDVQAGGRYTVISKQGTAPDGPGYSLLLDNEFARYPATVAKDRLEVRFRVRGEGMHEYKISGSDIGDYTDKDTLPGLPLDRGLRYVEIGPGMGGLIGHLTGTFGARMRHKPVAIEPSDIGLMKELLQFALGCGEVSRRHRNIMLEYISRLELLADPGKVTLLNMKLGDALANCPWLAGYADVVVELAGPTMYTDTEGLSEMEKDSKMKIIEAERSLLKPSGKLFNYYLTNR